MKGMRGIRKLVDPFPPGSGLGLVRDQLNLISGSYVMEQMASSSAGRATRLVSEMMPAGTSFANDAALLKQSSIIDEALAKNSITDHLARLNGSDILADMFPKNPLIDSMERIAALHESVLSPRIDASTFGIAPDVISQLNPPAVDLPNFGLSDHLQRLLADNLAAQEALYQERRSTPDDDKRVAQLDRKINIMMLVISLLTLCMYIGLEIEDRSTDPDEAIRANTKAIQEMSASFDTMADQLEEMKSQSAEHAAQELEQNAEIAEILREISTSIAEQRVSTEESED